MIVTTDFFTMNFMNLNVFSSLLMITAVDEDNDDNPERHRRHRRRPKFKEKRNKPQHYTLDIFKHR